MSYTTEQAINYLNASQIAFKTPVKTKSNTLEALQHLTEIKNDVAHTALNDIFLVKDEKGYSFPQDIDIDKHKADHFINVMQGLQSKAQLRHLIKHKK